MHPLVWYDTSHAFKRANNNGLINYLNRLRDRVLENLEFNDVVGYVTALLTAVAADLLVWIERITSAAERRLIARRFVVDMIGAAQA